MAFSRLEPWGEERADIRSAQLLAYLYCWFSGKRKVDLEPYMLRFDGDGTEEAQTDEQMLNVVAQFEHMHKGLFVNGNDKHNRGTANSPDGTVSQRDRGSGEAGN